MSFLRWLQAVNKSTDDPSMLVTTFSGIILGIIASCVSWVAGAGTLGGMIVAGVELWGYACNSTSLALSPGEWALVTFAVLSSSAIFNAILISTLVLWGKKSIYFRLICVGVISNKRGDDGPLRSRINVSYKELMKNKYESRQ